MKLELTAIERATIRTAMDMLEDEKTHVISLDTARIRRRVRKAIDVDELDSEPSFIDRGLKVLGKKPSDYDPPPPPDQSATDEERAVWKAAMADMQKRVREVVKVGQEVKTDITLSEDDLTWVRDKALKVGAPTQFADSLVDLNDKISNALSVNKGVQ
jgi:hypothetical protein